MATKGAVKLANKKKWTTQKEGEFIAPNPVNEAADPNSPRIMKDRTTGRITGVVFPDGQSFKADEVSSRQMIEDWQNSPDRIREQANKQLNAQQIYNEEEQKRLPKSEISQEQISQVGQLNPVTPNDLTNSIIQNQQNQKASQAMDIAIGALNPISLPLTLAGVGVSDVTGLGVKVLNSAFPGSGTALLEALSKNEKVQAYLGDYSNKENYDLIKQDMERSDKSIAVSKQLALIPGRKQEAFQLYQDAQNDKLRDLEQLRIISANDQGLYVNKAKKDMADLETYFEKYKYLDDYEMEQLLKGGVQ